MTEWVVTLRTGRRIELEADRYDYIPARGDALHTFVQADGSETGYSGNVVCVQRRNGVMLEQVWPLVDSPMCQYLTGKDHSTLKVGARDVNPADGSCPWEAVWYANGTPVCRAHVVSPEFELATIERVRPTE